jgi:hypothetical protein
MHENVELITQIDTQMYKIRYTIDTQKYQFPPKCTEKIIQISDNDVTFLHGFLLKFHALTSIFKIG